MLTVFALFVQFHLFTTTAILKYQADPHLYAEMVQLAKEESSWNPFAVSKKQACGLWQIRPKFWGHSCLTYMLSPWHSTNKAVAIVKQMKEKCGTCWKTCYRYGPYHKKSERCYRRARRE